MKVNYKLSNASICNKGICFKNTFILTPDITEDMILGTPFLAQIYPFTVSKEGIKYKDITFEFINPIKNKEIKTVTDENFLNKIENKQNKINYIKKEIKYKRKEKKKKKQQNNKK